MNVKGERYVMRIKVSGRYSNYTLRLGTQANIGQTKQYALDRARDWSPKNAKSFNILNFHNVNYWGNKVDYETGFSAFDVEYFSTRNEGTFIVYHHYTENFFFGRLENHSTVIN